MDVNTLIQLATLVSVIAGVIGLLISVRAYRRQVSAQFLLEYTRRTDEIMQSLPPSVWAAHLFPGEDLPEPSEDLRRAVLAPVFATDSAFLQEVERAQQGREMPEAS